ncbi:MAG: phospholipid carrier-dependent glycosyltransferase [Lentisphaeria bacterium]|nr:phospholipid carrier-dependent glycosyltransferase [Lentisphaeria bacterium]
MKNALLFLLFFSAVYLLPLGQRPLVTPDEFRYAEIPREMLCSGNFAVPRLMGRPYFEKPVLGYWLTAASFFLFGESPFSARLSAALSTGITALFIMLWVFSALYDKRQALLAGAMYLGCAVVWVLGTFVVLDPPMTAFSTGAMLCAFGYLQRERSRVSKILLLMLCGVCCGLGFMTKGLPALVAPALGALGFILLERRWKELFLMPWIPALFALLAVLPWGIAVHRADPDFWRYFIEVEHLQRFSQETDGQHPQPWWYLLPFFFGGLFPAALLLTAGIGGIRMILRKMAAVPLYRFALCAAVLPLVLFSCSRGKLPTYILPCIPPAAVLMAGFVALSLRENRKGEKCVCLLFDIAGCIAAAGGVLAVLTGYAVRFRFVPAPQELSAVSSAVTAAGACFAAAGALLLLSRKKAVRPRLWVFSLLFALPLAVVPFFIGGQVNESKMPSAIFGKIRRSFGIVPEKTVIVTIPSLMHAAAWEFGVTDIRLLGAVGEMEYADLRAKKEKRSPLTMNTADFRNFIRRKDRKDVLYLHWSDRSSIEVPGVAPALTFSDSDIAAKYYPAGAGGQK